jgi:hypothetical protein
MTLQEWLRWRWFCFWWNVCPKHRKVKDKRPPDAFSWCMDCIRERREERQRTLKKWGVQ